MLGCKLSLSGHKDLGHVPLPFSLCSSLNPAAVSQGREGPGSVSTKYGFRAFSALKDLTLQGANHQDHQENHPPNEVSLKRKFRNFVLESSQVLRPGKLHAQEEVNPFTL